jgi:hypothetical protein
MFVVISRYRYHLWTERSFHRFAEDLPPLSSIKIFAPALDKSAKGVFNTYQS